MMLHPAVFEKSDYYVSLFAFQISTFSFLSFFFFLPSGSLQQRQTLAQKPKKKLFTWLEHIFIGAWAGWWVLEEQRPASCVYNSPFSDVWSDISPRKLVKSVLQMADIWVLTYICWRLPRWNLEVKCINNTKGSKCLRLMSEEKPGRGLFAKTFWRVI